MILYATPFTFSIPIVIWIDSLNYILMSIVYLVLTIYYSIKNGVFLDYSEYNPVNYFFCLWITMPLQLLLAIFGESLLIPMFLVGLIGMLLYLAIFALILFVLKSGTLG